MANSNALSQNALQRLYTVPINQLRNKDLKLLSQAIDDNKLKTSVEDFFERNPKFAAHYIRKYKEYVKKRCPNLNKNNAKNGNRNGNRNTTINLITEASLSPPVKNTNNKENINNGIPNFSNAQEGGKRRKRKSSRKKTSRRKPSRKKAPRKKKVKRKVRTGPRGGKYILIHGRKKYL